MKKILLIIIVLLPSLIYAREKEVLINSDYTEIKKGSFWNKYFDFGAGVQGGISTNGFGIHGAAKLTDMFRVRLGYEYMSFHLSDKSYKSGGHLYSVKPKWKTGGFSMIVDARFYKGFFASLGLVNTATDIKMTMKLKNSINFGDIEYTPDEVGEYKLRLKPKNRVAPYLGVGWSTELFKNKRLSFNAEVGTYYIHTLKATATGTNMLSLNGNSESMQEVNDELSSMNWTRFYPVGRVSVTYMIF